MTVDRNTELQRLRNLHERTSYNLDDMDAEMREWASRGGPIKRWWRRRELARHLDLTATLRAEGLR